MERNQMMKEIIEMIVKIKHDKCKLRQVEEMAKVREAWISDKYKDMAIRDIWFYLRGLLEKEKTKGEHCCECTWVKPNGGKT
ncbi:MAG: hypothetical protein ACE5H1_00295 [Thermodesulfobacteriota bacterium]